LQSRDHVMRSLAQARFREESRVETQVSKAVTLELEKRGFKQEERKVENKFDALIAARHQELLAGPVQRKPKPDEETKQEWLAEHFAGLQPVRLQRQTAHVIDDWDEVDTPRSIRSMTRDDGKRLYERTEEKAPKPPRASSLKS